jgi:hypothetical protein
MADDPPRLLEDGQDTLAGAANLSGARRAETLQNRGIPMASSDP